jgi:hypothetical protein
MKRIALSSLAIALLAGAVSYGAATPAGKKIAGDYVEARTASVFAGACHYNGELVTTGRDAVMAWNFTAGTYNGVDLASAKAMAAVSSDANLSQDAAKKIEVVIDSRLTETQSAAVEALLREKLAPLGKVVAVRHAPVTFNHTGSDYVAKADGFAAMSVQPMPNKECCAQPNNVWYTPLFKIEGRKVGYTQTAAYTAGTIGDTWAREGENSAFYGSFEF